jgi:hypothetical protein
MQMVLVENSGGFKTQPKYSIELKSRIVIGYTKQNLLLCSPPVSVQLF